MDLTAYLGTLKVNDSGALNIGDLAELFNTAPWSTAVFLGIIIGLSMLLKRPRLPKRGRAFAALDIEWPHRFAGAIKVEGVGIIEFPVSEAESEALHAADGVIPAGQTLISHYKSWKDHDHHALVLIDQRFLEADRVMVEVKFRPVDGAKVVLPGKTEIEFSVVYIDEGTIIKTFEVSEREIFMRGSGQKSFEFKNLRRKLKKIVR